MYCFLVPQSVKSYLSVNTNIESLLMILFTVFNFVK